MPEISKFWKNREGYTLIDTAYLALDMPPKSDEKDHPLEVLRVVDDIKKTIKKYFPHDYPAIESGELGVSKLLVVAFAEFYGITYFFKEDPLREQALGLFDINTLTQKTTSQESKYSSDTFQKKDEIKPSEIEHNNPDKSSQLRALNQASVLWINADRDDKTTWTKTEDVVNFLIEKGFSKTLAKKGASIVRPDWAESGRIPSE